MKLRCFPSVAWSNICEHWNVPAWHREKLQLGDKKPKVTEYILSREFYSLAEEGGKWIQTISYYPVKIQS